MASGDGMQPPTEELAAMGLGGGDQGDRRDRRRGRFEELHTRPAHIVDKTGK